MDKKWGTLSYYTLWPLIWVYVQIRTRVNVVLVVGTEILFVKNWLGPNDWTLPGGGIDKGEQPIQAGLRELKEELGLAIQSAKLADQEIIHEKKWGLKLRGYYIIIKLDEKPEINPNHELTAVEWKNIHDVDLPISLDQ